MSISYGGVYLLEAWPDTQAFQHAYQSLDDSLVWGPSPGTGGHAGTGATRTPWGIPNYPAPPKMQMNQLYWPTGAARWSRGLFMASAEMVDSLMKKSTNGKTSLPLVLKDEATGQTITAPMYMLSPRPIQGESCEKPNYLLPLVDRRYFGQFMSETRIVGQGNGLDSWNDLIGVGMLIDNAIDPYWAQFTADEVSAVYLAPDYLFGQYQFGSRVIAPDVAFIDNSPDASIPIVTDAAAHSTGMRYVKQFDGSVSVKRFDSAWATVQSNLAQQRGRLIAGGELLNVAVPAAVQVWGPGRTYTEGVILDIPRQSRWYREFAAPSGVTALPYVIYPVRKIFTSCLEVNDTAPYKSLGDKTPDNITELNALADKIGADFYASQAHFYDYTFHGCVPWTFTPFCDHAVITLDTRGEESHWTTRVQSCAPGFGCVNMNHQTEVGEIYPDVCRYASHRGDGVDDVPLWPSINARMEDSYGATSTDPAKNHLVSVQYQDWTLTDDQGTSGMYRQSVVGMAAYDRKHGYWQAITAIVTFWDG